MRLSAVSCVVALLVAPVVAADEPTIVSSVPWVDGQTYTMFNGDTNGDFDRDVSDVVHLLSHLFLGGPAPTPIAQCDVESGLQNGDSNADGQVDLSDALHLLSWMYAGGMEPAAPCDFGAIAGATVLTNVTQITASPPPRFNLCNGDIVTLHGDITAVQHTVFSPNGSSSLSTLLIHWHNLTGTGVPSGETYGVNGGVSLVANNLAPGQVVTNIANERLITHDGEANFIVKLHFIFVMLEDGTIAVSISDLSFECTGE